MSHIYIINVELSWDWVELRLALQHACLDDWLHMTKNWFVWCDNSCGIRTYYLSYTMICHIILNIYITFSYMLIVTVAYWIRSSNHIIEVLWSIPAMAYLYRLLCFIRALFVSIRGWSLLTLQWGGGRAMRGGEKYCIFSWKVPWRFLRGVEIYPIKVWGGVK